MGVLGALALPQLVSGKVLHVLATLGISAVFLFAGVDLEPADFRRGRWPLLGNLVVNALVLGAVSWAALRYLHVRRQVAALLALAQPFVLHRMPARETGQGG